MAKSISLLGQFESKLIKMGTGRLFLGTSSGSTFDGTAKFDTNNPGASWEDAGAIANDFTIAATTDKFKFMNALPSVTRKTFVIGRDATITATFDEFKARVVQTALGLLAPFNIVSGSELVVQASPSPTAKVFTLDSVTGLAPGDEVVVGTTATLPSTANSGLVDSISGAQITLRAALPSGAPATGAKVKERVCAKLIFGGTDAREYPLLFVVDFVNDNKQFVALVPRACAQGNFQPNFNGGKQNIQTAVTWDTLALYDSGIDALSLITCFIFEGEQ